MTTLPQTSNMRIARQPGAGQVMVPGVAAVPHSSASKQMTGADAWRVIRSNIWIIIAAVVFAGVAGFLINQFVLLKYFARFTAKGYIQIQMPTDIRDPERDRLMENTERLTIDQRTQAQLLSTPSLYGRVLTNSQKIRETEWFRQFATTADAKEDLIDHLNVAPIADSRLIVVSMSYKKAKDCRDIVEEIVGGHLQEQQVFTRNKTSNRSMLLTRLKQSYQFNVGELTRQLNDLGARLSVDGMGVPGRIGATETELGNLVEMQLKMQLNHTAAANMYDQVVSQLREGIDPPQVEAMVDEDMTIRQLRMTRDNAEVAANVQEQQLGVGHPRAREARLTVEGYQKKLEETTEERKATARTQLVSTLRSQTQSTQEDLDAVTKRVNDSKSALGELSNKMASYLTLQDEEEALRELLNDVNEELANITQVETLQDRSSVGWAMHPEEPDKPSFPKLPMTLAFAIMLGLGISVGIAFLRELLDTSVRSPRDIARVGQMNLLGMVNDESEDPQSAGAHLPLVIFETPTSMLAEQLRQVRTRLQHAASLDTTRSILVTSPSPGDGKTTIAVNLAAGLALNGRRILLVDSNFRRPEIHKIFGLGNEMGFGDVLNSVDNFDQAIRQTQVPNLDVLVSGPKPANATELMESQLLIDFIERALEEYDHVIFDSGPILVVSETVALAPRVDGVVTVVRAKANSRGLLQRMRDALRQVRAEHLGVVLNAVRSQGGGYYRRNIKTYYEYQNGHAS